MKLHRLPDAGRFAYSAIHQRADYGGPQGSRLAKKAAQRRSASGLAVYLDCRNTVNARSGRNPLQLQPELVP